MSKRLTHTFDQRFELGVDVPDFVSYLHYDNNVDILSDLELKATDGKSHTGIRIEIRLTSAGTAFATPFSLEIPEFGGVFEDERIPLKLSPELFAAISSNRNGEFEFELFENEVSVGVASATSELTALNFWKRGSGSRTDALLLAAFSQPGDPAISKILNKAREIKATYRSSEGAPYSPTTAGYQNGPEEVRAEVRAVYEALQSFGIQYSNPLPNFNTFGQPIRTPSQILESKAATCLDSAALVASVLEAIGIHPVIITVPSHAFVGAWLVEDTFNHPVSLLSDVAGRIQADLQILETTKICQDEAMVSFEDACKQNEIWLDSEYLARNPDGTVSRTPRLVLDVVAARGSGSNIHSLPSVTVEANGSVTVIQTPLPKFEFNFTGSGSAARVSLRDDNSPARVKVWKTSLLDMSFNNPLLNRDRRRGSTVQLAVPNGKLGEVEDKLQSTDERGQAYKFGLEPFMRPVNENQFEAFRFNGRFGSLDDEWNSLANEILARRHSLPYIVTSQQYTATLKKLASASAASYQETGVNNLYLTFGSLTWDKKPDNPAEGQATSPLFLLPVTLKHLGRDKFELYLDDAGEAAPNETLAIKLAEFGINVPMLSNPETDLAGYDIPGLLKHVREQVNVVHKKESWVVNEDAFLGTFDFSNFHMWKDLHDNWSKLSKNPLVHHLIETDGTKAFVDKNTSDSPITDEEIDAEMARLPIESDAAQAKAIVKSLRGESFVIQGPPGTGKSQTITNLLARNLQEGKRVLFMSEKAAALGVVKSRLDEIGLGAYILDLHDKGTKPSAIRSQLLAALDAAPEADKTGLETARGEYETALRTLARYPERLHSVDEKYGESVFSAREKLLELPGNDFLALTRRFVVDTSKADFNKLLIDFRELPQIGQVARTAQQNEWSFSKATSETLTPEVKDSLKAQVKRIDQLMAQIKQNQTLLRLFESTETLSQLAAFKSLAGGVAASASDLAIARSAEGAGQRQNLRLQLSKLQELAAKNPFFNPSLRNLNVPAFQTQLTTANAGGLFKGKKLKAAAEELNRFLPLAISKDDVSEVFNNLAPILAHAERVDELKAGTVGLAAAANLDAFAPADLEALEARINELDALILATDPAINSNAQLLIDAIASGNSSAMGDLGEVGFLISELFATLNADEASISAWLWGKSIGQKLLEVTPAWKEGADDGDVRNLTRWAAVITIMQPLFATEQFEAINQLLDGSIHYDEAPRSLERTYFKLMFEKLVDDQDMSNFEGRSHDSKIDQLGAALKGLREYNRGLIASDVLAMRGFDASSNVGIAGNLRAELSRQRNQLPVRRLMKKYWQTITQVAPIVAASPDSVARFLDIDAAKFDIVVFDEASQIRVATAIGALGRASQAIIVGDTNQMPPTAMFGGSGSAKGVEELLDDDDQYSLNDQESILSMAENAQIPAEMLTWHYRSQDELLIAFANKHIYKGKLSSFPSPRLAVGNKEERRLRWDFDGSNYYVQSTKRHAKAESDVEPETDDLAGKGGTNLDEAKRVVAEIQKYVKAAGNKPLSLGVITMNEQQRSIIERLLDALDDDQIRRLRNDEIYPRDYLFVRALERVQGDERDVIFFSIGFAKTSKSSTLSMQFGPLTRARSERRLNVAVTRARKEMVVFSSFEPEEMNLTEISSDGLKLLQKFLVLAKGSEDEDGVSVATTSPLSIRNRHRADIADALRSSGFEVKENLGLSNFRVDIAIADPRDKEKCILGIMLDGPNWKQRHSASDRDVLPNVVLKNSMKWPGIERIWLPMWLRDRDGELARIKEAVDIALAQAELAAKGKEAEPEPVKVAGNEEMASPGTTEAIDLSDLLASAEKTMEAETQVPAAKAPKVPGLGVNIDEIDHFMSLQDKVMVDDKRYINYMHHPKVQELVSYLMDQLTKVEGPVSPKRTAVFIAKCFGYSTVQAAKREYILENIPNPPHEKDAEGFVYPAGIMPYDFDGWAKQFPGRGRAIEDISLTEIGNAMANLCKKTAGMNSPELAKQTSLAFGVTKLTKAADKRMFEAEKAAIKRGILAEHDGVIVSTQK